MKHIISIVLIGVAMFLTSCEGTWPNCVDGNGVIITETRDVSDFTNVESNGEFDVFIYPGNEREVIVEADENLMGLIITRVSGDNLIIETRRGNCIRSSENVRVTVNVPDLSHIDLNGSGNIWCDSLSTSSFETELDGSGTIQCVHMQVPEMDIDLDGSGNIEMDGTYTTVKAVIDGSGEITLSGISPDADFLINGSGNIRADELETNTCYARITGSGSIYTWVEELLDVNISGSGNVYYYGESPLVNTRITGSGQVIKKN